MDDIGVGQLSGVSGCPASLSHIIHCFVVIFAMYQFLPQGSDRFSGDLVVEAAPLQKGAETIAESCKVDRGLFGQQESFFASGAHGAFFVLFVAHNLVDDLALNAFHAQFVLERARTAWAELLACFEPEGAESTIIDQRQMIQARDGLVDQFGRSLFAAQVAAYLLAAARAK